MAAGQSRLELVLDLKNRIGVGLAQARTQINNEVGGMQARIGAFAAKTKKDLSSIGGGFAPIKSGIASIINPVTLAITGVGLLGKGLMNATNRAADFNSKFRELANLNLDKSRKEIDSLRKLTLQTAWDKGLNADKVKSGIFDVQSTVGLYGSDAARFAGKQGEFATLMQADMNEYIAGSAKAMANWRFGVDDLDNFNRSAYATMKVGVTTFDQLSKVQSVYAGASAAINQTYDTANKLFALFTVRTKSVYEAATLTKSLFNDLTKATTIKAFKQVGIDVYDSNKQLKQADTILLELNRKFLKMKDDRAIVTLKNQFTGSEGLIAMIQAATDRTGELKNTFDKFSDTKMSVDAALSEAHNDIIFRQEKLANRIDNLVIRMGQTLLPLKEKLVGAAEWVVGRVNWNTKSSDEKKETLTEQQKKSVYDKYGFLLSKAQTMSQEEYTKAMGALQYDANKYQKAYDDKTVSYANQSWLTYSPYANLNGHQAKLNFMDERTNHDRNFDLARSKAFKSLMYDLQDAWINKDKKPLAPAPATGADTGTAGGGLSGVNDSLTKVTGAASAPRNITINIDAFVKGGINTQNTSLQKMDASQIEEWFTDMLMRVVNNAEMSYNN